MELDKLCKRLDRVRDNITKAYAKDINKIVDESFFEYDIFYKNTNQKVDKQVFLRRFLWMFEEYEQEIKICVGVSQNGNKCCRRAYENTNYCKTHQYLQVKQQLKDQKVYNDIIIIESKTDNLQVDKLKIEQIDGSFYYKDDSFVYDKQTLERVGYVEGNTCILTDDPFILNI